MAGYDDYVIGPDDKHINYTVIEPIRTNFLERTELIKVKLLSGTFATIKKLFQTKPKFVLRFENEVDVIQPLKHENVIQYMGCLQVKLDGKYLLMTEWASLGQLDELITKWKNTSKFNDARFYSISTQVCKGLQYLQERDDAIVHGDIRSRNIFAFFGTNSLDEEDKWIVKLAEFGSSTVHRHGHVVESSSSITGGGGEVDPIRWQAPEVLLGAVGNEKSDLWSLNVVFGEILEGETVPFKNITKTPVFNIPDAIDEGQKPFDIPSTYHEKLLDLLEKGWDTEPAVRYPIHTILQMLVEMKDDPEVKIKDWNVGGGGEEEESTSSATLPGGAEGFTPHDTR